MKKMTNSEKANAISDKDLMNILGTRFGESRAIKVREMLEDKLGIKKTDGTSSTIRSKIIKFTLSQRLPIVSSNKGFYVAANWDDIKKYKANLQSRIKGLEYRQSIVDEVGEEYYGPIQEKTKFTRKE